MRLINADELPELETIEAVKGKEVYTVSWIPKRAIEAAPTVEAIPIEWIKQQFGCYEYVQDEDNAYYYYDSCLKILLEDWEAENGRKNAG